MNNYMENYDSSTGQQVIGGLGAVGAVGIGTAAYQYNKYKKEIVNFLKWSQDEIKLDKPVMGIPEYIDKLQNSKFYYILSNNLKNDLNAMKKQSIDKYNSLINDSNYKGYSTSLKKKNSTIFNSRNDYSNHKYSVSSDPTEYESIRPIKKYYFEEGVLQKAIEDNPRSYGSIFSPKSSSSLYENTYQRLPSREAGDVAEQIVKK